MKHQRRGDREGMLHNLLFQVTKGNKFLASEALSGAFGFERGVVYRAFIYGLSEATGPLFEVATLTGFEEATAINCIELQSTA
jgi:hypothetical protein